MPINTERAVLVAGFNELNSQLDSLTNSGTEKKLVLSQDEADAYTQLHAEWKKIRDQLAGKK